LSSESTVDVVQVVAILLQVLPVGVYEGQAVAAGLEFGDTQVTGPVPVAVEVVGVEPEVVGADEAILGT